MNLRTLGVGIILSVIFFPSVLLAQTSFVLSVTDASGTPITKPTKYYPPPAPEKPMTFIFAKNLQKGDTFTDVLYLQKLLNQDPDTQIATTGSGAPGQETSYFGQLTKEAVIRFQNKYAVVVLKPYGLIAGTGFVGTATRGMLNKL